MSREMRTVRFMQLQPLDLDGVRRLLGTWSVDCGARVAARRAERGWDRAELAERVGTTEATIHRVESGTLTPRDYLKLAIAAALGSEVAEIWRFPPAATVHDRAASVR